MTRSSEILLREEREAFLEINPKDIEKLDIRNGQMVKLRSRRGEINIRAKATERVPEGVVYTAFHFAESPINQLTNPARDPVAKCPEYKVCAVALEALES